MIPLFIGGVGTNPPPTSITHFSPSTSSFTHFSRDYSNLWLRTELPMCLRTVRPLYILPLSSRLRTAPFYMFALSTCPCTRALLTNRGHKLGSPFGVEAPSGALESLEGPIILAPTSTPYHLESPLISREQSLLLKSVNWRIFPGQTPTPGERTFTASRATPSRAPPSPR
jgi:hypothetical protein